MRAAILTLGLLPYAWFGLSDNVYHARHRVVPGAERLAHAAIVLALLTVVPQAYLGNRGMVLAGLVLFVAARAVDEYVFHRKLPVAESALHARTHFAFLTYVFTILAVDWAEANAWDVSF
jgi:hypothetical protein